MRIVFKGWVIASKMEGVSHLENVEAEQESPQDFVGQQGQEEGQEGSDQEGRYLNAVNGGMVQPVQCGGGDGAAHVALDMAELESQSLRQKEPRRVLEPQPDVDESQGTSQQVGVSNSVSPLFSAEQMQQIVQSMGTEQGFKFIADIQPEQVHGS